MDDLLQFVMADKVDEFKAVAANYVKADVDAIKQNIALFDKVVAGPIATREKNLRENEFPKLIEAERERIKKEYAPKEETPEQKRLRELEDKLAAKEAKEQEFERRNILRSKYKETAPDVAEQLYKLDDDSVDSVLDYIGKLKSQIDELEKKNRFGSKAPAGSTGPAGRDFGKMKVTDVMAYARTSPEAQEEVLSWQRNDRMSP